MNLSLILNPVAPQPNKAPVKRAGIVPQYLKAASSDSVRFSGEAAKKPSVDINNVYMDGDAIIVMKNAFKMVAPPPKEVTPYLNLMGLLLSSPSVQSYLSKSCKVKHQTLSTWIDSKCLDAYAADQQESGAADVKWIIDKKNKKRDDSQPIIDKLKTFAAQEGDVEVTPVTIWRWIMQTNPMGNMDDLLKLSGLDAAKIEVLRRAEKPVDYMTEEAPPLTVDEILDMRKSMNEMKGRIVDQDDVVDRVVNAILGAIDGVELDEMNPNQPRGTFMFMGPSGVGKTYLSKLIAKYTNRDVIYLTMSEYMDKMDAKKLTGSAVGYVGYGDPCFVDKVIGSIKKARQEGRRAPVIIFDELEKADKNVIKTLMQVLDQGQMESSDQEVAYFRDCLITMTSNVAQKELAAMKKQLLDVDKKLVELLPAADAPAPDEEALSAGKELVEAITESEQDGRIAFAKELVNNIATLKTKPALTPEMREDLVGSLAEELELVAKNGLKEAVGAEVYGRIQHTLVFNSITPEGARTILDQHVEAFQKKAEKKYGSKVIVDQSTKDQIFKKGFDFETGVRTLKNFLGTYVRDPLTPFIQDLKVEGKKLEGSTITTHWNGRKTVFTYQPAPEPVAPPPAPATAPTAEAPKSPEAQA